MITHELKIEPRWLQRVIDRDKTAEVRLNDRDFQVGDWLNLREWKTFSQDDGISYSDYGNRSVMVEVTHVLTEAPGVKRGYAVLSFTLGGKDGAK